MRFQFEQVQGVIINMEKSNISTIKIGKQNVITLVLKKIAEGIGCEIREFFE